MQFHTVNDSLRHRCTSSRAQNASLVQMGVPLPTARPCPSSRTFGRLFRSPKEQPFCSRTSPFSEGDHDGQDYTENRSGRCLPPHYRWDRQAVRTRRPASVQALESASFSSQVFWESILASYLVHDHIRLEIRKAFSSHFRVRNQPPRRKLHLAQVPPWFPERRLGSTLSMLGQDLRRNPAQQLPGGTGNSCFVTTLQRACHRHRFEDMVARRTAADS